jgi:hypothetical protein
MVPPRGSLDQVGVPAILRALVRADKTGPLRFTRGRTTKTVYLSDGRLIFATSTDPDDRLGEMLLRKGLISYRDLEESVRGIRAGRRQGTILVERGAIRSRDLVQGVTEQVQEIVYSLFLWQDGLYEFVEGDLPSREVILLRMPTEDILMEGIRRVDEEWRKATEGKRTVRREVIAADRNQPGRYFAIVFFDSLACVGRPRARDLRPPRRVATDGLWLG